MNAMTQALKTAGVKVPSQSQRIWQWLHDKGSNTSKSVANAIGVKFGSVSSLLSDMVSRGMVSTRTEYHAPSRRSIRVYSALGDKFERLPYTLTCPKKVKPTPVQSLTPLRPGPLVVIPPAFDLDSLTVKQARELYLQLHKMFGGK